MAYFMLYNIYIYIYYIYILLYSINSARITMLMLMNKNYVFSTKLTVLITDVCKVIKKDKREEDKAEYYILNAVALETDKTILIFSNTNLQIGLYIVEVEVYTQVKRTFQSVFVWVRDYETLGIIVNDKLNVVKEYTLSKNEKKTLNQLLDRLKKDK